MEERQRKGQKEGSEDEQNGEEKCQELLAIKNTKKKQGHFCFKNQGN